MYFLLPILLDLFICSAKPYMDKEDFQFIIQTPSLCFDLSLYLLFSYLIVRHNKWLCISFYNNKCGNILKNEVQIR